YPKYFPTSLSTQMPADAWVIQMEPGSVLFLPRGYWHETVALEPCISLSFVLKTATWGDVALSVMDRIVESSVQWREPAPLAPEAQRAAAGQRIQAEIARMCRDLQDFPSDSALLLDDRRFAMIPSSQCHLARTDAPHGSPWVLSVTTAEN